MNEIASGSTEGEINCFVIGPIGDKDAAQGSRERIQYEQGVTVLEEVIEPACIGFGIRPLRADKISRPGEISEQVCRHLRDSYLVIADLTDRLRRPCSG